MRGTSSDAGSIALEDNNFDGMPEVEEVDSIENYKSVKVVP
jgi:hypothetical protein